MIEPLSMTWLYHLTAATIGATALIAAALSLVAAERACARRRDRNEDGHREDPERHGGAGLLAPFAARFVAELRRIGNGLVQERRAAVSPAVRLGAFAMLAMGLLAFAAVPFGPALLDGDGALALRPVFVPGLAAGLLWALAGWGLTTVAALVAAETPAEAEAAAQRGAAAVALLPASLGVVVTGGALALDELVHGQTAGGVWNVAPHPLGLVALFLCAHSLCAFRETDQEGETHDATPETNVAGRGAFAAIHRRFPSAVAAALALQRMLAAYLAVVLFLGGWHMWGLAPGGPAGTTGWSQWLLGTVVLHAKALAVLWAWSRWGARLRLPEGVWLAAVALGVVDLAVAIVPFERLFGGAAWLARAALGWSVLVGIAGFRSRGSTYS